ncbi:MAG: hypothetical protein QM703_10715 [Gemmatales bacterium]
METSLERAWQLYRFRRYSLALEETVKFLGQYPESAEAFCLAALIHGKEKRQKQAIKAAEAAIRYMPDWSYPHYVHALVSYWFNKYHLALKSLSEALRIQPTDPDFFELVSAIHAEQGHHHTSLEMAEHGLQYNPEHVGCLSRAGTALFNLKKRKQAEEVFKQILIVEPENTLAQGYVGHFLVQMGQFEEALPLLRHALQDHPDWSIVQEAWKESLRAQYPFYGWLAWFKQRYLWKRLWVTYLVLLVITSCLVFASYGPDLNVRTAVTVVLGPSLAVVVMLGLIAIVAAGLHFTSSFLLFWNRDLRRSYDWPTWTNIKQEIKGDWFYFLIPIGIILVVYFYKAITKAG